MKTFDESLLRIEVTGRCVLGGTLRVEHSLERGYSAERFGMLQKDFEQQLEAETTWYLISPSETDFKREVVGDELYLDETAFEKRLMVMTKFKAKDFLWNGMPFQRQFKEVDLDDGRLRETLQALQAGKSVACGSEVDRLYVTSAQSLSELCCEIAGVHGVELSSDHSSFLYELYRKGQQSEQQRWKLRTLEEEKTFWKQSSDDLKLQLEAAQTELERVSALSSRLKEENDLLMEEKNLFLSSKTLRGTTEASFLDERSHEMMNQTHFIAMVGRENIVPIPNLQNNTFDLTLIDEELQQSELRREVSQLQDRLNEYERANRALKRDVQVFREVYSAQHIEEICSENDRLKVQLEASQNQVAEFKNKLLGYNFTLKYMEKEMEDLRSFRSFFSGGGNDEKFIMASQLTNSLTKELFEKNKRIEELEVQISGLRVDPRNQTI